MAVTEPIHHDRTKQVSRSCTVVKMVNAEQILRLWGCDCAERALTVANVTDHRSWDAIKVARLLADGKATREELVATARAAAWAAAEAARAARTTAWAAAEAAGTAGAARAAGTTGAARTTAWAAWAAAKTAARTTARTTAWAARAARTTAWAAAEAAGTAGAARAAEVEWQKNKLQEMILTEMEKVVVK